MMRPTSEAKRHPPPAPIAATATRRAGLDEAPIAVIAPWEGLGGLILLFCASLAYVVTGGAFAPDPSPIPEADTQIAAQAVDAGAAAREQEIAGRFAPPAGYFAAAYARQARGGDANPLTYARD